MLGNQELATKLGLTYDPSLYGLGIMRADPRIVKKLKAFDPYLYVTWNNKNKWFEIWRRMPHGRRLITPVTQSIYSLKAPVRFCQLDERILWWLYEADSWRHGGGKKQENIRHNEYVKFLANQERTRVQSFRDMGKDMYQGASNFFFTKHASKNKRGGSFNNFKPNTWLRPDIQKITSPRIMTRSRANALKYNFRPK